MALIDRLEAIAPVSGRVQILLASLSKEEAAVLSRFLADPAIATYAIWTVLRDEGHKISRDTIQRYRNENTQP